MTEEKEICVNPDDLHQFYSSENPGDLSNTVPKRHLGEMWDELMKVHAESVAFSMERPIGTWVDWTFAQYYEQARNLGRSLLAVGFKDFDSVNILGHNCPEWAFIAMGAILARGVVAGAYITNQENALRYMANHSGCKVVFADCVMQLQKYLNVAAETESVTTYVLWEDDVPEDISLPEGKKVYSWKDFLALGGEGEAKDKLEAELEIKKNSLIPNQCCVLVYTSGTTGNPKAVMLSHDTTVFGGICQAHQLHNSFPTVDVMRTVSYLPLSHVAGLYSDVMVPFVATALNVLPSRVYFARKDALKCSLMETVKAVQPNSFFGVPRIWEKLYENLEKALKEGLAKIDAHHAQAAEGNSTPRKKTELEASKDKSMLHKKLLESIGLQNCLIGCSGAAPIAKEIKAFFKGLGLPLTEGYGMSETCARGTITLIPDRIVGGTIGEVCDGMEMKIHNPDENGEGEICFRGRALMMGYMHNEEKSKETIDSERWLHSGDLGKTIEHNGHVNFIITGRMKDLIITAGGENIAPSNIENCLKARLPFASYACVIGDKRKFLSVVLAISCVVDPKTGRTTDTLTFPVNGKTLLSEARKDDSEGGLLSKIQDAITDYNSSSEDCVSNAQKVQYFYVPEKDFTNQGEVTQLTATQKLKRREILTQFSEEIDMMYAPGYNSMKQGPNTSE